MLPLNDEQQLGIARTMRGDTGEKLVDQAWRPARMRDLIAIPLYLNVLLSLPGARRSRSRRKKCCGGLLSPKNKKPAAGAALSAATNGLQQNYLEENSQFSPLRRRTRPSRTATRAGRSLAPHATKRPAYPIADACKRYSVGGAAKTATPRSPISSHKSRPNENTMVNCTCCTKR